MEAKDKGRLQREICEINRTGHTNTTARAQRRAGNRKVGDLGPRKLVSINPEDMRQRKRRKETRVFV